MVPLCKHFLSSAKCATTDSRERLKNKPAFKSAVNPYSMKAFCANNELDKPMQMSLEAIGTDLDKMNRGHIRGTNGSHQ